MKILFLSGWFPYPADNGSKIRISNLLKGLAQHHDITLLTFSQGKNDQEFIPDLERICRKVVVIPWKEYNPRSLKSISGFLDPRPRSYVDTYSHEMELQLKDELENGYKYNLLIASQLTMAVYKKSWCSLPGLLEEIELATILDRFKKEKPGIGKFRYSINWIKEKHFIINLLKEFKACTVVSSREKEIITGIVPTFKHVHVIPNCLDMAEYQGVSFKPEPETIIFTGSFSYSANYDAVCFFLKDIYPLIKMKIPTVRFKITGRSNNKKLPINLLDESVELTGFVDDVKSQIANSWVSVVPLIAGGGTRFKILEAMALGTPVVSTSKGAEGLEAIDKYHLFIADNPQEFADCVINLFNNPELHFRLRENGRQFVQEKYNWQIVLKEFLEIVENISTG